MNDYFSQASISKASFYSANNSSSVIFIFDLENSSRSNPSTISYSQFPNTKLIKILNYTLKFSRERKEDSLSKSIMASISH